jgi:hypothetical protein
VAEPNALLVAVEELVHAAVRSDVEVLDVAMPYRRRVIFYAVVKPLDGSVQRITVEDTQNDREAWARRVRADSSVGTAGRDR